MCTSRKPDLKRSSKKPKMRFIEETHEYIEADIKYLPATSFVKKFEPFVDWDKKAATKAKKLGVTKEVLLKEWEDKRNTGARRGTAYHKLKEDEAVLKGVVVVGEKAYPAKWQPTIGGIKDDESMKLENNTVYVEKLLWSKAYGISGQADIVEVIDGYINIKDHKTNAKLEKFAWVHPATGPVRMLAPVKHLERCTFNSYQLQLNLYMFMALQANRGLKMGKMVILHVLLDEEGNFVSEEPHEVQDLQIEIRSMLEHYKNTK